MKSPFVYIIRRGSAVFFLLLLLLASPGFNSCMEYGPMHEEELDFGLEGEGLFITNEGNFMYGNASLSYYIPSQKRAENEVFIRANGINLGDVAQSMTIRGGLGYIVVNNSGIIFIVDIYTFRVVGSLGPFTSPRYIHFLNDTKAYVTQLWDNRIAVVNPAERKITGYIETPMAPGSESTEQMVRWGDYVFVNCWSYNNRILVIDSRSDQITDEIEVGIQPLSMAIDKNGKLWVITDGGYQGSPYGYEAPTLWRIDAATRTVEQVFAFELGDPVRGLSIDGAGDTIYFINKAVWRMDVSDTRLPSEPLIPYQGTLYYGIAIHPETSEVYVADAIDYVQPGVVLRYGADGTFIDKFRVGITPGSFCFIPSNP